MIHQYKLGGYNIILDICSGSVHAVDDVTYDLIAGFENTERDALISDISSKYPDIDSKEIGEIYHLTKERIRQIEKKVLSGLRNNNEVNELKAYIA